MPRGLIRYLIVGILSFALDFTLLFVLHDLIGWPIWISTTIAFLFSFVVNYLLQRGFSFSSSVPHGSALLKYVSLVAANALITVFIVDYFAGTAFGWAAGKIISVGLTTLWNYFLLRFWLFPLQEEGRPDSRE